MPNGLAQQALLRAALEDAGVRAEQVGYVEAHGTGTPLGDPIELRALGSVLGAGRPAGERLWVGSVKSNIGHLEAAAGVAGLVKVVLALEHEQLPAHLHFRTPNPHVDWEGLPVAVASEPVPWPRSERPRIAGVSSFGMSGTNAHVIVSEAPAETEDPSPPPAGSGRGWFVLPLSAKSEGALRALARRYLARLAEVSDPGELASLCAGAGRSRSHFAHRLAVIAPDPPSAITRLEAWLDGHQHPDVRHGIAPAGRPGKLAWLFTGQGSQSLHMARTLYDTEPVFKAALERCAELLDGQLEVPLLDLIYPPTGTDPEHAQALLDQTANTQPALFAIEWALAQLWQHWGINPDIVLGHSVGELTAATIAGVLELPDALRLVSERGRLMQTLPPGGAMLAVALPPEQLAPYLTPQVVIAAHNSPTETVLAGPQTAITHLQHQLAHVKTTRLHVSHAFHSPDMEPILPAFQHTAAQITYHPPTHTLISNLTGQPAGPEITTPQYWTDHIRQPVQFTTALHTTHTHHTTTYQEIGPHPTLLTNAQHTLEDPTTTYLPTLRRNHNDHHQNLTTLATLYTQGHNPNWTNHTHHTPTHHTTLPTYPFQRQRYWVDTRRRRRAVVQDRSELEDRLYTRTWRPRESDAGDGDGPAPGAWVILADRTGVGEATARALEARGDRPVVVVPGERLVTGSGGDWQVSPDEPDRLRQALVASGADTGALRGIIHLWSLDGELPADGPAPCRASGGAARQPAAHGSGARRAPVARAAPNLGGHARSPAVDGEDGGAPLQAPTVGARSLGRARASRPVGRACRPGPGRGGSRWRAGRDDRHGRRRDRGGAPRERPVRRAGGASGADRDDRVATYVSSEGTFT